MTLQAKVNDNLLPAEGDPDYGVEITPEIERLLDMLSYKRPDGGMTDWEFIGKFIASVSPKSEIDQEGNVWIKVGESPILWSCHTDTVHHDEGRQEVVVKGGWARVVFKSETHGKSNALGADDTAGCWLMTEMIRAKVPGLYVFHRGEEVGGRGSMYAARHETARLDGIKYAIALDRKGYGDVITHQFNSRCCSNAFAKSLAKILGGSFAPDDTGMFTDTANYTDVIGECTNLSVGYFDNHGPTERLNLPFVAHLRKTLIEADFSSLVFEREPGEVDENDWYGESYGNYGGNYGGKWDRPGAYASYDPDAPKYRRGDDGVYRLEDYTPGGGRFLPLARMSLVNFVKAHPESVADMLEHDGWDTDSLAEYLDVEVGAPHDA